MSLAIRVSRLAVLPLLLVTIAAPALAGTLQVTIFDARTQQPIGGAFVMVGPGKGIPFAGNTAFTPADGIVVFTDPALVGPQTVSAGAAGFAYTAVIESASGSVRLPLYPSAAQNGIYGPKARVTGPVTGINTVSNDGKLDIGMVLPAVSIDSVIGGNLNVEIPPDTASFPPPMGTIQLPGNIVVPYQTEYYILHFNKPNYKIDLPAQTTQSMYVVSARIPIGDILNFPSGGDPTQLLKAAEIRQFGIQRDKPIGNGLNLTIAAPDTLHTQLTVVVNGAPHGTEVTAFSLGSLPKPGGGEEIVGYDTDFALADTLGSFLLASSNPGGDIPDVSNLVAGVYQDSSAYAAFSSGRIDRTHFTLPATRALSDFYVPPTLTRQGARLFWNDVHTPGSEPTPTWTVHSISAGPLSPADTSVATTLLWRIIAPAGPGQFALPSLPAEAPGPPAGLIDVNATPEADRLIWDATIANPSGDLARVLTNPMDGVTHFSERAMTLDLNPADVEDGRTIRAPFAMRLAPNPSTGDVRIRFAWPLPRPMRLEVIDAGGRRVRTVDLAAGTRDARWDGHDASGRRAAPGMYIFRSEDSALRVAVKVLIIR